MSDRDWQACAEQMATGLALVDADLRLQWLNPALAEWLEWGPRSALGQPLAGVLGDASRQAQRSLAQQRPVQLRGVTLTAVSGTALLTAVQFGEDRLVVLCKTEFVTVAGQ